MFFFKKEWIPILSISFTAFLLVTSELIPIGILNQISHEFIITPSLAGLMITMPSVVAAFSAILIPFLFKNIDRKKIFTFFTTMMFLSNICVYISHDFYNILLGRLILGVAIGGFATLAITSCSLFTPNKKNIAKAISIVMAGMTLATVVGLPLGIWLSGLFNWRFIFLVISIFSLIILLIQLIFLPNTKPKYTIKLRNLMVLLLDKQTQKHIIISLFIYLSHFISYSYVSVLLKEKYHLNIKEIGFILCVFGISNITGNFISSKSKKENIYSYLLFSFFVFCLSFFIILFLNLNLLIIGCILWGLSFGIFSTATNIYLLYYAPETSENGMPFFISMIQLTITFGSLIGGLLLDRQGIIYVFITSLIIFMFSYSYYKFSISYNNKKIKT